jgi:hypothetical protein
MHLKIPFSQLRAADCLQGCKRAAAGFDPWLAKARGSVAI